MDSEHAVTQGRSLVSAIEALETIEPSAWFERNIARLLVKSYKLRLHAIIGAAPAWVGNRILAASDCCTGALFGEDCGMSAWNSASNTPSGPLVVLVPVPFDTCHELT